MHRSAGLASLALVLVAGCASPTETHSAEGTTTSSGLSDIERQPLMESSPSELAASAAADATCQPGDERTCKRTYLDAQGASHYLSATQFCSSDGTGWLPCGEVPAEQDAGSN